MEGDPAAQMQAPPEAAGDQTPASVQSPAADAAPDIMSRIGEIDPDVLFQAHPELKRRFDGAVGVHAQRQAQQIARSMADQMAVDKAQAIADGERQRELERLRNTDLIQWDQQDREFRAQQAIRAAEQAPINAGLAAIAQHDQEVLNATLAQQHPDVQRAFITKAQQTGGYAIRGQDGSVDGFASRRAAYAELMQMAKEYEVKVARQQWESQRTTAADAEREALKKDLLAELNGGVSVDTGAGVPSGGVPTLQEWGALSTAQRIEMTKRDPQIEQRVQQAALAAGEGIPFDMMKNGAR